MMRIRSYLRLILFGCLFASSLWASTLIHEPLERVLSHKALEFDVRIPGASQDTIVTLFYKTEEDPIYTTIPLGYIGEDDFNLIYKPKLDGDIFQYYFEVTQGNTRFTFPEFKPEENPIEVLIQQPAGIKPDITFIYPEDKSVHKEPVTSVLVTIDDPDRALELDTFYMSLNHRDMSNDADISDSFIQLPLQDLSDGKHAVNLVLYDYTGKAHKRALSFSTYKTLPQFMTIKGSTSFNGNYFHSSQPNTGFQRLSEETQFRTDIAIKMQQLHTKFSLLRDSRDNSTRQPLNRLGVQLHDSKKRFNVHAGDFTPYFTDMTLSYLFVQGYDVEADLLAPLGAKGGLKVRSIRGRTRRSIAISSPNVTQGTYEQLISASQIQLNVLKSKNSINYVKIQDNLSSLSSPVSSNITPVENHVISIANRFSLFKTKIDLESAASIHYSDLTAAIVDDVDDLNLPIKGKLRDDILKEFPARSSLFIGYGSRLKIKRDLVPRKVAFNGKINYVSPGFNSLGSSSIQKDIFEYGGDLSLRTFKNRVNISGGIRRSHDNVLFVKEKMTFANTYSLRTNTYVPNVGSFFVAYTTTDRENKVVQTEDVVTGNLDIQNSLRSVSLGVSGIQFKNDGYTNTLSTHYSFTNFDDNVTTTNTFDTHSGSLHLQSKRDPITISLGLNLTNQINHTTTANTTLFTTYTAKIDIHAIPKHLRLYAGIDVVRGQNNGKDLNSRENSTRTTYTLGGQFNWKQFYIFKRPSLSLNWSMGQTEDSLNPTDTTKNFDDTLFTVRFNSSF